MVTRAKRQGGILGWPHAGNRSAKSSSAKMVPSRSRKVRYGFPLGNAACAMRPVSVGTGWIGTGLSDIRRPRSYVLLCNWLRVSDPAERSQVDQRIGQQLHAIVPLLEAFKAEQQ